MTQLSAIAEREKFLIAYPDGLLRGWNALNGEKDPRDDLAFIARLIEDISQRYSVDPGRVYAVGASNGAMMTYRLACEMPEIFAAMAVVMGAPMPEELAAECIADQPMPLLMIHGTEDAVLPYEGGEVEAGEEMIFSLLGVEESFDLWRVRNGCMGMVEQDVIAPPTSLSKTSVERWTATGCAEGAEVVLYRVIGGGHTWPGGRMRARGYLLGATSHRIDASEVVWDFFEGHENK
jgi:polyhydroxybutyrate depolymerase